MLKAFALVLGAGRSGIEASGLLLKTGEQVVLYDGNTALDELKLVHGVCEAADGTVTASVLKNGETYDLQVESKGRDRLGHLTVVLGDLPEKVIEASFLAVISPGISPELPFVQRIYAKNVPVISEIELAYRYEAGQVIGITGTNGKTTTTTLVGDVMKVWRGEDRAFTVGNIGLPYTREVLRSGEKTISTIELSSFQLETIDSFHPHVAAILNLTPDHLNRHHTMEEYARVKERVAENQTAEDHLILNASDPVLKAFGEGVKGPKIHWFSGREPLEDGYYLEGDALYHKASGKAPEKLIDTSETTLVGRCNYENILAAVAMADAMGVPRAVTLKTVRDFKAVPHRIEYTETVGGVKYYNDSKGTNPDAAIQGILAMQGRTVLIGGGYDKGLEFDEWIEAFQGKVKLLILIGQTREKIKETANRHGFTDTVFAESLEEAVKIAAENALPGENVLLSPACASWGMFENYEQRGDLFKQYVHEMKARENEG